jgi:uncharacterized protein
VRLTFASIVCGALALTTVGCSSPSPSLYTIAPVDGAVKNGAPRVVLIQQVALARYLERPQIVRSSENYRLDIMANDWWGEPLAAMIGRILAEELAQRLPQSMVLNESGTISTQPDATVALNIQRLDETTDGVVTLRAQASITFERQGIPELRSFRLELPRRSPGIPGEVAAISAAVGQLADQLASALVTGRVAR